MAYWGMAMANVNNEKRAKAFTEKAVKLKDKASAREKQWIGMLETLYKDDKRDKKQRSLDCIRDLENLVQDDPKDIEAKAFLVWRIWFPAGEAPISSPRLSMRCSIKFSPPRPIIPRITTASICGIRANPSAPSPPPRSAARPHPASPTCGTCPATPSPN
jgi:hypothetical protein